MTDDYAHHLYCPYCHHGEILVTNRAKVTISSICPVCSNLFYADLQSLQTYRRQDYERVGKNKLIFQYHIRCPCPECTGEIRADGIAAVTISFRCSKKQCRSYFTADLITLETEMSTPVRKQGRTRK